MWGVHEMNTDTITAFITKQLDEWCGRGYSWDKLGTYRMDDYKQTSTLLGACGHDTRELDQAITDARVVLDVLVAARDKAVARFKAEGVYFTVDESRRKEVKAARLQ